jgi:hypothetical protein
MPITASDFVWRYPRIVSTTPATNGGRMAGGAIGDNVKNALFPDVTQAQRDAGVTHLRKAFIHVSSSSTISLLDAKVWIGSPTESDDFVVLIPGTQTDTEVDATGRCYGAGALYTSASASAGSISIVPDGIGDFGVLEPFQAGDEIVISDGTNAEHHTIDTVTNNGTYLTLALTGTLSNPFDQADTVVASVIEVAEVVASVDSVVVSSASGTLDSTALIAHNRGATRDTITLTFTSATEYSAAGLVAGDLGIGTTNSSFAPSNPSTSGPRFTIPSTAWGGTFADGDDVEFELHPAAIPIWYRRVVPAGADSLANATVSVTVTGESAS